MTQQGYRPPPSDAGSTTLEAVRAHTRQIAGAVHGLFQGKANVTTSFTLTASATSTDLMDPRLSADSAVLFDPMTANAAGELAAGTMYVTASNRNAGTWTVTHASAPSTDRTFRVLIMG